MAAPLDRYGWPNPGLTVGRSGGALQLKLDAAGLVVKTPAPVSYPGSAVLTIADMLVNRRALLNGAAAPATWTTPSAAAIVAAIDGAAVGDEFQFQACMSSADSAAGYSVTLAGGAGVTIVTPAVSTGDAAGLPTTRTFSFRLTNVTAGHEAVDVY